MPDVPWHIQNQDPTPQFNNTPNPWEIGGAPDGGDGGPPPINNQPSDPFSQTSLQTTPGREIDPRIGELEDFFRKQIDEGIFGNEGIDRIMASVRAGRDRASLRLQSGLRKRASRRLGTRSGAVEQIALNATGQSIAGEQTIKANLEQANQLSRLSGVQGLFDLVRFGESQRQFDEGMKEQIRQFNEANQGSGFSFTDLVPLFVDIGLAFATGGASVPASVAQRV